MANDRILTIHVQTGDEVYLFGPDKILPNDSELLKTIWDNHWNDEVTGSAQGQGIDTVWWDGSNESIMYSTDPMELKQRADMVRNVPQPGAKAVKPSKSDTRRFVWTDGDFEIKKP